MYLERKCHNFAMLNNFNSEIQNVLNWYQRAKEVTIIAESMDNYSKGYIQPMHEQRYSFDHFIRAIAYEENSDDEKIKSALSSTIAHLQRAYSDSVEWILVTVKEEYHRIFEEYGPDNIMTVFPEYYSEIRPAIIDIAKKVNDYKMSKSVEEANDTASISQDKQKKLDDISNQFLSENVVRRLQEYLSILRNTEPLLIEVKSKRSKEQLRDKWIIPGIMTVGGAALGTLFGFFL